MGIRKERDLFGSDDNDQISLLVDDCAMTLDEGGGAKSRVVMVSPSATTIAATSLTMTVVEALLVNNLTPQWWKICMAMAKDQKDPQQRWFL